MEDHIHHRHKNKITQMWKNVQDNWVIHLNSVVQNKKHFKDQV